MTAALIAGLAGLLAAAEPATVRVRVLEKLRPEAVALSRPGERHAVVAGREGLFLDGAPAAAPLRFPAGRWRVEVDGAGPRFYRGAPSFDAASGRLAVVVRMRIEDYVADVVASETLPGTPLGALKAQAVVVRSYALATRGRHGSADLCDLAHCQVLRGGGPARHGSAARAAARATAGELLWLASGRVAAAPFHAACGGHTGDPAELFGGEETGAAAVADPGCPVAAWSATVPASTFGRAANELLAPGEAAAALPGPADLDLRRGAGGFVVQVARGERRVGGEAFARHLDGAMGYGVVRSSRFEARAQGGAVLLLGSGIGHGVGLCQAGARLRAERGEGYREILRHYFPRARLATQGR